MVQLYPLIKGGAPPALMISGTRTDSLLSAATLAVSSTMSGFEARLYPIFRSPVDLLVCV